MRKTLTSIPDIPSFMILCPLPYHDQEYREIFSDWINNWVKLLKKAILLGQSQGRYINVDAECAARTISAIYQGIATRWYLARGEHPTSWAVESLRRSVKGLLDSYEGPIKKERREAKTKKLRK